MSLATRCAACGTVFRVVQDQLRVSSGWVRCGRCGEVFNAIESLVDLEIDRPGDGGPPSVHGARVMEALARVAGKGEPGASPDQPSRAGGHLPSASERGPDVPLPTQVNDWRSEGLLPHPVTATHTDALGHAGLDAGATTDGVAPLESNPAQDGSLDPLSELPATWAAPAFVRQADRAARWRHPAVRALLSLIGVLAFVLLGWQVSLMHHDWLAARWPLLSPILERVCVAGGCLIEPPRRIDRWTVDSSGLVRSGVADHYRLTLVLRNRDEVGLRTPAVDLVLTDAVGQVIARRVLLAPDFGVAFAEIDGGASRALTATLEVGNTPVVGYTIELFYP